MPARNWALGLMIVASAGALLATSDVEHPTYNFEVSSEGPRATLSASAPQTHYLVRARVTALGPKDVDTTESALAKVHGTISASASAPGNDAGAGPTSAGASGTVDGASPFVQVRFGAEGQGSNAVTALTSFQLSRPLQFTGNCAQPEQGTPCQAELELDFALTQLNALPADSTLSIAWSVDFEARAFKPKDAGNADERLAAPWTIELVQQ